MDHDEFEAPTAEDVALGGFGLPFLGDVARIGVDLVPHDVALSRVLRSVEMTN